MRRLLFLLLIAFLAGTLSVGCSSKKRTRKASDDSNSNATANNESNEASTDSGESKAEPAKTEGGSAAGNDLDAPPASRGGARPRGGMRSGDNLVAGGGTAPVGNNRRAVAGARRPRGGMRPGDNLVAGGGTAPVGNNRRAVAGARRPRGGMRPGDNLALGGGARPPARNRQPDPPAESFAGGGLPNGFYPQPSTGDAEFAAEGTLPNGFYPQPASGGPITAPPPAPIKPAAQFRDAAMAGFQQRDNAAAMSHLWAYILASDDNIKKYPVKYFPGMGYISGSLRWGVGVSYTNRSDNTTPIAIGDPVGYREEARTNRGGSRGSRGARGSRGGSGSLENEGSSRPQNSGGNSDYALVDVDNPEGFVLYYAGDYGDKFLERLSSRFTNAEGFYGDIYKEFLVDYSNESTGAAGAAQRPQGQRRGVRQRGQRRGDNLSAGGGQRPAGGGRPGGAGGNSGSQPKSDRLKRLLRNTPASTPSGDKIGMIMPGVMLVGQDKRDKLIERAQNMDLDLLVIFNVRVSTSRKSYGTTSLKVYNLRAEEPDDIASGRSLKSDKIADQRAGLTDAARDPVDLALEKVFAEELDQAVKATEIPDEMKSSSDRIESYIKNLVSKKPLNVLPLMHKILSFREQGMIDEKFARQQLNGLLGGVLGDTFIDADEKGRAEILSTFIKRAESALGGIQ